MVLTPGWFYVFICQKSEGFGRQNASLSDKAYLKVLVLLIRFKYMGQEFHSIILIEVPRQN